MNLLLSTTFLECSWNNNTVIFSDCPIAAADEFMAAIDQIPAFSSAVVLREALVAAAAKMHCQSSLQDPGAQVLTWIWITYSKQIVLAKGDLYIKDMPRSIKQFVLVGSEPKLEQRFQ